MLQYEGIEDIISEISQSQKGKDKHCMIPATLGVLRVVKIIEAESRMVVIRGWGAGDRELVFSGYRVAVGKDEKGHRDGCGEACALQMYLILLNSSLKNDYDGKFNVMCIYHNKKRGRQVNASVWRLNKTCGEMFCRHTCM